MDFKKIHTAVTDDQNAQADEMGRLPKQARTLYLAVRAACQQDGDGLNEMSQTRENVTLRFDYPYICELLVSRTNVDPKKREQLLNTIMAIDYFDGNRGLEEQSENFHANYKSLAGMCTTEMRRDLGAIYAAEEGE